VRSNTNACEFTMISSTGVRSPKNPKGLNKKLEREKTVAKALSYAEDARLNYDPENPAARFLTA
jgi:hypothetical protein